MSSSVPDPDPVTLALPCGYHSPTLVTAVNDNGDQVVPWCGCGHLTVAQVAVELAHLRAMSSRARAVRDSTRSVMVRQAVQIILGEE